MTVERVLLREWVSKHGRLWESNGIQTGCALIGFLYIAAIWLFGALLFYGVVVIIFRYAFGVELPNPMHWL